MSSILPKIDALQQISFFHQKYAEAIMNLVLIKTDETEELDVGRFIEENDSGLVLGFDGDEFENSRLELRYVNNEFVLVVSEHSEGHNTSQFTYKISDESELYSMISEKIKTAMVPFYGEVDDDTDF